ncbi:macrolide transporter [Betaproteobacteria bacterium]|nr:macrolide transporter [Betaproteobacteria bacterium]GHU03894.1 macrolide transporter [Betaproteobacteria bacterium]GHU19933.1 macrolide transporter [Betaproteobacteria bacterium]
MTSTPSKSLALSAKPRWTKRLLIAAAILLVVTGGWLAKNFLSGNGKATNAYQFATVQRGDIEDLVTATGTLQPREYVDVGAQVSGQLQKIHVEVGSQVKAGELLAEIDPTVYLSKVDASRAMLRNQRAQLKEREAQLTLAQIQFKRQTALMAEDATTTESVQTAEATLKSAEASLEALRAQIEQTESSLRGDEASLRYARVLAPMNGTVVSISARQGQTLNTNQQAPTILRVADLSTMTVQTQVSEADIGRLRPGIQAYFTTLGSQTQRWYSTLDKIEPTPTTTNNVVLYNALFDVPNADGRLMTDMTAQVFFVVAQARDVLQIPLGALQARGPRPEGARQGEGGERRAPPAGANAPDRAQNPTPTPSAQHQNAKAPDAAPRTRRATVKVLDRHGNLSERTIEVGVTNRIQAQVLSGLEEGDKVVSGRATATSGAASTGPRFGPRI